MASIENRRTKRQRKRKENNYWIRWWESGTRCAYHAGDVSKDEAKRIKSGIEAGLYPEDYEGAHLQLAPESTITLKDVVEDWLEKYAKQKKRSYQDDVYRAGKHIFAANFGAGDIRDLSETDCEDFLNGLVQKPLSPGAGTGKRGQGTTLSKQSANHIHKILRQSLDRAVKRRLIGFNPMTNIRPFALPESDRYITQVLKPKETAALWSIKMPSRRYICIVAVFTGMRRGEVFGLTWDDYDQTGKHVGFHVRHSYAGETKGSRLRWVPAIKELQESMAEWKALWPTVSGLGRPPRGDDLIFPVDGSGGRMRSRGSKYRLISGIRQVTKRTDIVFHDLRHTACTRMAQARINIHVIQKAMGHSNIRITERYIHTEDDLMAEEFAKMTGVRTDQSETDEGAEEK